MLYFESNFTWVCSHQSCYQQVIGLENGVPPAVPTVLTHIVVTRRRSPGKDFGDVYFVVFAIQLNIFYRV